MFSFLIPLISAVAGIYSGYQQYKAADEARDVAREQARYDRRATDEEVRRAGNQQAYQESIARAMAAKSGVTGSPQRYIEQMEAENERQLRWMQEAGYRGADITERQGESARRQGQAGAIGTLGQTFGRYGTSLWEAGTDLWGQTK